MGHYKTSVGSQEPIHILAVQRAMIEHCEKMHDRFCLLDSLPGHNMQEAVKWRGHLGTSHASLYFSWVKGGKGDEVAAPPPPPRHNAGNNPPHHQPQGGNRAPGQQP